MRFFLVTGGAGFIGSNLVEYLLKKGEKVRIIDNFLTGKKENINIFKNDIEIIEGDLRNQKLMKNSLKKITHVIHLAAIPFLIESIKNPQKISKNNILGTISLFDNISKFYSKNIEKIVQASSSSVYGDVKKIPIKENIRINPLSPYAVDKASQELYANVFSYIYKLNVVSLRFFNVYGKRQNIKSEYSGVISKFLNRIKNNKKIHVYGDGNAIRDYIYIKDLVRGIYYSSIRENKNLHQIFNLGSEKSVSVNDLISLIKKIIKKPIFVEYKKERIGEIKKSVADISNMKNIFKYDIKYSLEEGLNEYIDYFFYKIK